MIRFFFLADVTSGAWTDKLNSPWGGVIRCDAPSPATGALGDGSQLSVPGTSLPREADVYMERNDEHAADGGEAPRRTLEVHFKLFGTDGVSLQSQELSKALGARGWRAFSCASDVPPHADGLTLPELSYPVARCCPPAKEGLLDLRGGHPPTSDGDSLVMEIIKRAERIRRQVEDYVDTWKSGCCIFATSCLCRTTFRPLSLCTIDD